MWKLIPTRATATAKVENPQGDVGQETLASAVVYLFDLGKESLANALIQCSLRLETTHISLTPIPLIGDVRATLVGRGAAISELSQESKTITSTIDTCLPPHVRLLRHYDYDFDAERALRGGSGLVCHCDYALEFRAGLVSAVYQETTRRLVELGGIEAPSVRNLRIKQHGQEYALKPIPIFPIGVFERNPKLCFLTLSRIHAGDAQATFAPTGCVDA